MEGFIVMAALLGVYMFYKMYKNDQKADVVVGRAKGTDTVLNTKLLEQKESSFNNNYLLKIYMRSIQSLLGKHITTGYLLRYK